MANLVQTTVDAFWHQLQRLENLAKHLSADLEADRLALQGAYSETRRESPAIAAAHQRLLQPQIHNNSVLRLRYKELVGRFNQAVAGASDALKRVGFSTPNLSGLGIAPVVLVPVVAVAALGAAFLIYETVRAQTDVQRKSTAELIRILHDPTSSEADKARAAAAIARAAGTPPPGLGLDLGAVVPILGLVAVIMLGPQLLQLLPKRRAA